MNKKKQRYLSAAVRREEYSFNGEKLLEEDLYLNDGAGCQSVQRFPVKTIMENGRPRQYVHAGLLSAIREAQAEGYEILFALETRRYTEEEGGSMNGAAE